MQLVACSCGFIIHVLQAPQQPLPGFVLRFGHVDFRLVNLSCNALAVTSFTGVDVWSCCCHASACATLSQAGNDCRACHQLPRVWAAIWAGFVLPALQKSTLLVSSSAQVAVWAHLFMLNLNTLTVALHGL